MSWYDWINPWEQTKATYNFGKGLFTGTPIQENEAPPYNGPPTAGSAADGRPILQDTGLPAPYGTDDALRQNLLAQQGGRAGMFADSAEQGYKQYGKQAQSSLDYLRAQARGENSVSAEQLRQGLQQNVAAQRSLAAGASPRNAAMAARTASIQSARLGAGMAGQQSVAGLQERNQANKAYGDLLAQMRGQDLSAATASRQNAMSGYGAGMYGAPPKSWIEEYGPAITAGAGAVAAAYSDRRLKTDVKDGGKKADEMLDGLKRASTYRYKDDELGKGEFTGPMAQDLERVGSRAVIDTPRGKMVHGARLATENTAMIAALRDRVAKLEGGKRR